MDKDRAAGLSPLGRGLCESHKLARIHFLELRCKLPQTAQNNSGALTLKSRCGQGLLPLAALGGHPPCLLQPPGAWSLASLARGHMAPTPPRCLHAPNFPLCICVVTQTSPKAPGHWTLGHLLSLSSPLHRPSFQVRSHQQALAVSPMCHRPAK